MPLALTAAILHFGLMDGSAGIAISYDDFVTISDEVNQIKRFAVKEESVGTMALDLDAQKEWFRSRLNEEDPRMHIEADIEGAARMGNVIYWIGSHGFHKKESEDHRVFFATTISDDGKLAPSGKVYRRLLDDLLMEESLKSFELKKASKIKPKQGAEKDTPGGLNIEGLCTAKDGKTLLICFRNPIPGGKALIVPLENPAALVEGKGAAKFGKPILLKLGGLGLRDMVWWRGKYLMIAGHYDSHLRDEDGKPNTAVPASQLYRWSGNVDDKPTQLDLDLSALNPEALIVFPDQRVMILSDDGGAQKAAFRKDPLQAQVHFRSVWLTGAE
jgi:Protein of unknown function (DUF3616)